MARFRGKIGFIQTELGASGVHVPFATEHIYNGDVLRDSRRLEEGPGLNDNLNINNKFSVVGDAYAYGNFSFMKYIEWMGQYWTITNVEVQTPRLILTIGGLYNGPVAN